MDFFSDIALSFIAFSLGRFFVKKNFKPTGPSVFVITLMESLLAGLFIVLFMYYAVSLPLDFSLLLGAIATAPASTMVTISQYKAKGLFVNTLLQVVALDDAVCLLAFSSVLAIIQSQSANSGLFFFFPFSTTSWLLQLVMGQATF